MMDLFVQTGATISKCGQYRYGLSRRWSDDPMCLMAGFIMLNPSTADASLDDPTIRRCIGFAKREGCGGLYVVNLFGLRATKPEMLRTHFHPMGPEWRDYFDMYLDFITGPLIAAWGADPFATAQAETVRGIIRARGIKALCLGHTKDGSPRHPLYLKADAPLVPL